MKNTGKILPADVAGKYQLKEGHGVGEYHFKGHVIHLDRISLAEADKQVAKGFPYLVLKPVKKAKAKT